MRDFFHKLYCATYRLPDWMTRIKLAGLTRRIIKYIANPYVRHAFEGQEKLSQAQSDVVISLTSFPKRIATLWIVIECLLRQTVRPRKIVLWLSKDQFDSIDELPARLLAQRERGLDIRLVDGDIRSHKKYYYAFKEFADSPVLLVDDDIIYDSHLVEDLVRNFSKDKVHCSYSYLIKRNSKGEPMPYSDWTPIYTTHPTDKDLFFGSGGGTLLVPSMLKAESTDIETALRLCPSADDVWLNAIVRLSGLEVVKVREESCLPVIIKDNQKLAFSNQGCNRNDVQINAVNEYFKDKTGQTVF